MEHKPTKQVKTCASSARRSAQVAPSDPRTNLRTCARLLEGAQVAQVGSASAPRSLLLAFFAPGDPKGEPRPRAGQHGIYVPAVADRWKHDVRAAAVGAMLRDDEGTSRAARLPAELFEGPVRVTLDFYFARPKSHLRRDGSLRPTAPRWHLQTPDFDNLAKSTVDALGAWADLPPLLWANDAQIVSSIETKSWAGPGTDPGAWIMVHDAGAL